MSTLILKVLILGGTHFLGPHLVQELQERGHEVTLFNRGTQAGFSDVEMLRGDRDGNLGALEGRFWDAIIDTSGFQPRIVEASSKILAAATKHYTFISTIGVYENFHVLDIDENYPLVQWEGEATEEALKVACEKVVERYFPDHFLVVRPGLIMGPRNPTHRFSYWPLRIRDGGEVLCPGTSLQNLQFIDVRDLAKWIVTMVENQKTGFYNATGPASPINFEQFLNACAQFSDKASSLSWVDEDFLIGHDVQDWTQLPLWLSYKRHRPGFFHIDSRKAIHAGLTFQPLSETLSAVIDWETQTPKENKPWLKRKKEQELLEEWKDLQN